MLPELPFPIELTRHPRSRRISVRVHPLRRCVILNVPRRVNLERGIEFLIQKRPWIEQQLAAHVPAATLIRDGLPLTLFGTPYTLKHNPGQRGALLEGGMLVMGGGAEFLPRRLRDFLAKHAKRIFTEKTFAALERHTEFGRCKKPVVAVRQMTSRWGSCTRKGRLCFNWRLVFAPDFVADYLVAHELAHLLHHNHGPRFWALAQQMCPRTDEAKHWLRRHGRTLYRYL